MDVEKYLTQRRLEIDKTLIKCLPGKKSSIVAEAMHYSVFSGGKRIRPILTISTAESLGCEGRDVLLTACGIELIHNFTLIHDDLPCMDNDDFRRGKLTTHKVYGEAIAILAGDALLNYGFKLIAQDFMLHKKKSQLYAKIFSELCEAVGTGGVIGGQAEDLLLKGKIIKKINLPLLESIYSRKTGALICVAIRIGAILGQTTREKLSLLTSYGKNLGIAFQIMDDILEAKHDRQIKDDKLTCLSLVRPNQAKLIANRKIKQAKKCLQSFGPKSKILRCLADYIIKREN